jgi:hypothetical protein
MLFSVVQTRLTGVRLTREEIAAAAPLVGRLSIHDWQKGNSSGRALRVATLRHPSISYQADLLLPIFDPVIVRMTDAGFLLIGWQIETLPDNRTAEHSQGWWVTAAAG